MMRLQRYCSCGGKLDIKVPKHLKAAALAIWFSYHGGAGHAPATRKEAKKHGTRT